MAVAVKISALYSEENHYLNREVDELDEQKVNFKSQPNKEKSYLWILPVVDCTVTKNKIFGTRKTGV